MSDATIDDGLAYARTLAQTYTITSNYQSQKYNVNLSTYISTVYFAYLMHQQTLTKYQALIYMANVCKNNGFIATHL